MVDAILLMDAILLPDVILVVDGDERIPLIIACYFTGEFCAPYA